MALPPKMTYPQQQARAAAKRKLALDFLANGEIYFNAEIATILISTSRSSALRTLASMVNDGELKTEEHFVKGRKVVIYGITSHGLALADKFDQNPFELGKNSSYLQHHFETQLARLKAEDEGWTCWTPGKTLHEKGLKKIPDAIATNSSGVRVALEIERHIKTPKRYQEIIGAHLLGCSNKLWDEVHYLTPAGLSGRLHKLFLSIKKVNVPTLGELVMEPSHYNRFKFHDLQNWPGETNESRHKVG